MDLKKIAIFFAVICAVSAEEAPSLAPGPAAGGDDCMSVLVTLQDCLDYVTVGSPAKKPNAGCCGNLKTVLEDKPTCLCQGFTLAKQLGVNIDKPKASTLPSSCKLSAANAANAASCSFLVSPAGAPTPAEVSPSASSPSSEGVSPSTVPGGSSVSKSAFSLSVGPLLAGLVLVVAYSSGF